MKLLILVVAILSVAAGANVLSRYNTAAKTRHIESDIKELLELIPVQEIIDIVKKHLAKNDAFKNFVDFLKSDEFRSKIKDLKNIPEVEEIIKKILSLNVDIKSVARDIYNWLKSKNFDLSPHSSDKSSGEEKDAGNIISEIINALPLKELGEWIQKKYETSKVFRDFVHSIDIEKFATIYNKLKENDTFKAFLANAADAGFPIDSYLQLLYKLMKNAIPKKE